MWSKHKLIHYYWKWNGERDEHTETDESESVNKPSVCAKKVDDERWSFKTKANFFFSLKRTLTNVSNRTNLTEKLVLYNNRTENVMCVRLWRIVHGKEKNFAPPTFNYLYKCMKQKKREQKKYIEFFLMLIWKGKFALIPIPTSTKIIRTTHILGETKHCLCFFLLCDCKRWRWCAYVSILCVDENKIIS